ncbi:MAG: hypothetical protein AAGF85_22435 [Bacteroidota bacterium]
MNIRAYLPPFVVVLFLTDAFCLPSITKNEKELFNTLLSQRNQIDTLFSIEELQLIEEIKQSFEAKITSSNLDLVLRSCYADIMPVLNEHKKSLQNISKQLYDRCLAQHDNNTDKKEAKKLKFITSPLPLILLVDYRFIKLFEL